MEINLHVTQVLPPMSGTSKSSGKQWTKQEFIGETYDQFQKLVCCTVFNPSENTPIPNVGDSVTVSFDLESRSWTDKNGTERWSTEVKVWKIQPNTSNDEIGPATKQQQPIMTQFQNPQPPTNPAATYPEPPYPQGMVTAPQVPQAPQAQPRPMMQPTEDDDDLPF